MNKLITLLAAACIMISLTGCTTTNDPLEVPAEDVQTTSATTTDTSAKPDDTNSAPEESTTAPEGTSAQPEEQPSDAADAINLEELYQAIIASQGEEKQGELFMFPESDPGLIEAMYTGLTSVEGIKQQVFYIAPVTGFACEVMLIEADSEDTAATIADICRQRIEYGASDEFYPETAALWATNAEVQTQGCYVCMVALPEGCEIPDDIFSLI